MKKRFPFLFAAPVWLLTCGVVGWANAQVVASLPHPAPQGKVGAHSLKDALSTLEVRHQVSFFYENRLVAEKYLSAQLTSNQSLEKTLRLLLQPFNLTGKKIDKSTYAIFEVTPARSAMGNQEVPTRQPDAQPVAADPAGSVVAKPDFAISGRVVNDQNEGLPGVSVVLKGTTTGTATDADGRYRLTLPDNQVNGTLIFSYIGYTSEEVAINNRTTIDLELVPDIASLSEVVVVGYGTQKRADLTGSIASVKAEEIKNMPTRSVAEAIQGRAAGVEVIKDNGAPGAGSSIIIRGASSLTGNNSPFYVVDGIPTGNVGNIFNIQDIESIEILKDASAAAIYGAQAARGVVLITTKKGSKDGTLRVGFSAYTGIRQATRLPQLLNTTDFLEARRLTGTTYPGDPSTLPNTDWVGALFGGGREQNYTATVSGGGAKSTFFLSANYQREDGIRINNWFDRFTVRLNSEHQINKRIKFGQTLRLWTSQEQPTVSGDIPYRSVPIMAIYDASNPVGGWGKSPTGFNGGNYVGQEYSNLRRNTNYGLEGNVYLDYNIVKGLNFRTTFGGGIGADNYYLFELPYDFGVNQRATNRLERKYGLGTGYVVNYALTYDKSFGQHNFKVLAGYEQRDGSGSEVTATAFNSSVPGNLSFNPVFFASDPNKYASGDLIRGGIGVSSLIKSTFARFNYDYAGKYFLTANIRRDGFFNKFGPGNQYGVFPSLSGAWRLSDEAFIKDNLLFVSNLKLRGGYGVLGNSDINDFLFATRYQRVNRGSIGGGLITPGIGLAGLGNRDIRWESVYQTDIGLDIGFLQNKVEVVIDYYDRVNKDALYYVPLAISAGLGDNVATNIGQIRNSGLEVALTYRDKTNGGFTYSVGFNAAFNRNVVERLDGVSNNPIYAGGIYAITNASTSRTMVGQPLGTFWGYQVSGIAQTDAQVKALNDAARAAAIARGADPASVYYQNQLTAAGDLLFRDLNGDGRIDDGSDQTDSEGRIKQSDKTIIGNPWPKMTYGITLNLGYKGFDLTALLTGVAGVDVYNSTRNNTQNFGGDGDGNTTRDIFGTSFFGANGVTDRPRVGFFQTNPANIRTYVRDPNGNYSNVSSYFVEDGSYLRLRNLQLGYSLPKTVLSSLHIQSARLYLMGQNLLTFTKYSGLDPEIAADNALQRGLDAFYYYPKTRLFSLGVDVTF